MAKTRALSKSVRQVASRPERQIVGSGVDPSGADVAKVVGVAEGDSAGGADDVGAARRLNACRTTWPFSRLWDD
jgi:hypothetical protein